MSQGATKETELGIESVVLIAMDGRGAAGFERRYWLCRAADLAEPGAALKAPDSGSLPGMIKEMSATGALVVIYPTRTAGNGFAGQLFSDIAPEDRAMIRQIRAACPVRCVKVSLSETSVFESLPGYLQGEDELRRYRAEKLSPAPIAEPSGRPRRLVEIDLRFLARMKEIFVSCMTKPNRQDYMWLATKTFGLNLAIRLVFVTKGVMSGDLPMARAVASTSWYQLQDAVFTVFGQTYMKFLGRMTGLLRIHNGYFGDFLFVYVQLCLFEFINRLVLGPIGENPLVYTWSGMGLIFVNILQGMFSGGPIIPAINKMRNAGVISHSTMMHCYQLASLTMHFGLFATFGYQKFYAMLTAAVLAVSWTAYIVFTTFFKDPQFVRESALLPALDNAAARGYASVDAASA